MLLELHPEALEELEAAVVWHNRERAGRGDLLYDEVRRRVAQATRFPKSGAPWLVSTLGTTCGVTVSSASLTGSSPRL